MEVAALEQNQLPLGFSMALAQHPKAMERFSRFTASEKETVLELEKILEVTATQQCHLMIF